jgi:hypothetical protein
MKLANAKAPSATKQKASLGHGIEREVIKEEGNRDTEICTAQNARSASADGHRRKRLSGCN